VTPLAYQILDMLVSASEGNPQQIPDPAHILPYIGLYIVVHLKTEELLNAYISTPVFPELSILQEDQWVSAPISTLPNAPNAARIFDVMDFPAGIPCGASGDIPLSTDHRDYHQKRYWRLPKSTLAGMLTAVMLRAISTSSMAEEELERVRILYSYLILKKSGRLSGGGSGGPSGGSGGLSGGLDGPSGSGPGCQHGGNRNEPSAVGKRTRKNEAADQKDQKECFYYIRRTSFYHPDSREG
jgi:hypothetical protein